MELYFKVYVAAPGNNDLKMNYQQTGTFLTQSIGVGYVYSDKNANSISLKDHPELVVNGFHRIQASKAFAIFMPSSAKENPIGLPLFRGLLAAKAGKWPLTVVIEIVRDDMQLNPFDAIRLTKAAFHSYAIDKFGFWLNFYADGEFVFTEYDNL